MWPGEVNLWPEVETKVTVGGMGAASASSASSEHVGGCKGPVHMVIHLGDFLSVDEILRSRVVQLLDLLLREDSSIDAWEALLRETEGAIRDAYRRAFSGPMVQRMFRRCGHVFLAGQGEAGMVTSSLLGMGVPDVAAVGGMPEDAAEAKNLVASGGEDKKSVYHAAKAAKEAAAVQAAAALAAANRMPLKRGEFEELIESPEDVTDAPLVGGAVRRQREASKVVVDSRTRLQEELRVLLLGLVIRLARRVNWSYMRQMWDEEYEYFANEDLQNEANQREILRTRKVLQIKTLMLGHLTRTKNKIVREFGEEYKASERVAARCVVVEADVREQEQRLRDLLSQSAIIISSSREPPNGACIDLGGMVLVLVETAWGWLGRDGQALSIYNRNAPLHADVCMLEYNKLSNSSF